MNAIQPVPRPPQSPVLAPMPRSRRTFSNRFRLAAVRRVVEDGETLTAVALELGIHRSTLGRWKRRLAAECAGTTPCRVEHLAALAPLVETLSRQPHDTAIPDKERVSESLHAALRGESDPVDWASLLDDGLALQRHRLRRLSDVDETAGQLKRALLRDAAEGQSLIRETQDAIDRMIHSGKMETAKRLTTFRSEIRQGLSEIVDRIGLEAYREAKARTERRDPESTTVLLRTTHETDARQVSRETEVRRHHRSQPEPRAVRRDRSLPLMYLLGVLLLLWVATSLPRMLQRPLPELGFADFRHVSGITDLTARPPSLFVELDADFWNELSRTDRRQLIGKIGITAHGAGYRGVHCRTTEGVAVASWLRQRGPQLVGEWDAAPPGAYVVPPF